jgi:predicted aminopeptidase
MKWLRYFLMIIASLGISACTSMEYYWQAINGHTAILNREQPIDELLANPDLDSDLRHILQGMQQARDFASQELALPDNDSYRVFADIERDYVIWNVIATDEFSVTPQQWCFPFAGCVSYRGFFNQADANAFAAQLRAQGKDVYVAGARAYSTLGWFDDPLLNTMLYRDEAMRVGVLFHELAHQQLYVQNDTAFNEAFATTVAQEGVRRWFLHNGNSAAYESYLLSSQRRSEFNTLLQQTRSRLKQMYSESQDVNVLRKQKQQVFEELQQEYARLKQQQWNNDSHYDKWMAQPLNNAHLALVATYHDLVPAFHMHLKNVNSNLPSFYKQMQQLAELPKVERHDRLMHPISKQSFSQAP